MNIQQIQYVLSVAEYRHFERAAEKCFVTQSTLSTMISRFEEELGIKIFDRKRKPVELTAEGEKLIDQLKLIDREIDHLKELSSEIKGEVNGDLTISVVPTIAPFLLPLFLQSFAKSFPALNLTVREQTTDEIIRSLKSRDLDIGIISIPTKDESLREIKLYDESFVFYNAAEQFKKLLVTKQLDVSKLCLLEEGHCMRTQVLRLCDLHKKHLKQQLNFDFKAGSIDSLLRFVRANQATTLLPYLSTIDFQEEEKNKLSYFKEPIPYRTVGLVVHRHFAREKVLQELEKSIRQEVNKILPNQHIHKGEMLDPI